MPSTSTGPSPLCMPLHSSPRLVAQMTGLTLQQSALEVQQQHKLKRMLRRIRQARRLHRTTPRSGRLHVRSKANVMSLLKLPEPEVVEGERGNDQEWSDDDDGEDEEERRVVRKMDVVMDISDMPGEPELQRRVARLINQVFEPRTPVRGAQIGVHRLSGAMTNCVYMVTVGGSTSVLPKYLLRVYGTGVDEILSREKELFWLGQLTQLGFGPQVFGIFGNGRLEEYLESSTLGRDDIRHASTSKHIARRMSELHALVSHYRPVESGLGGLGGLGGAGDLSRPFLSGRADLWTNTDAWMRLVQSKWARISAVCGASAECADVLRRWPEVERLALRLRRCVDAAQSPLVFAHADLQYGNILKLRATGELVVVDFEYAGYNYRAFDIANHFCEWMADYHHPQTPHLLDERAYPSADQQRAFLRTYIRTKAFLDANMRADADIVESDNAGDDELRAVNLSEERLHKEVDLMEKEIRPFVPASHLHWGVWGLLQAASSEIDFDYAGYAAQRLSLFMRMVAELDE